MFQTSLPLFPRSFTPTFSGHETFALRGNWLKKAYDLLSEFPDLFYREDAFVILGVGKNMAQSIRFWGRVCGVFERAGTGNRHYTTSLGNKLLADDGWDPFLVTPTARWLLHWQIVSRPEAAFTWYYTFNLLRGGEFTAKQLAGQVRTFATEQSWSVPSEATINRDVECMLHCYLRPAAKQIAAAVEDALACPLGDLGLIQALPGQSAYRLISAPQPDLPDALVALAAHSLLRAMGRQTISFTELAYSPGSPGRVFRLDEDALLERLQRIDEVTDSRAYYTEQAGIRQVGWRDVNEGADDDMLLERAFGYEVRP